MNFFVFLLFGVVFSMSLGGGSEERRKGGSQRGTAAAAAARQLREPSQTGADSPSRQSSRPARPLSYCSALLFSHLNFSISTSLVAL